MTINAGIYCRQSLDRTGEGLAVSRQRTDCVKLAKAKGWRVGGEYVDNDISASGRKPRPEYRRLLADVKAGRLDAIVAWAPDRLLRRPVELEELLDLVENRGVVVATVTGGDYDLSTPGGRGIARVFSSIARMEVEQKGARHMRANIQRAESGRTPFTRRPFGYTGHGDELVEVEAAEIRRAADLVLAGGTLASIVADLNARGFPTSTGGRWTTTTVRRVLLNPRNAGLATYKGKVTCSGAWPAVYDVETHEALVRTLTHPSRLKHNGTAHKYLLSGLARCGRCGAKADVPMFASPMGKPGEYWMVYRCRTSHLARRLDLVDEVVQAAIIARLSMSDAADLMADDGVDLGALRTEAQKVRLQLDELADLFAEGAVTAEGLRKAGAKLRARLDDIDRQCADAGTAGRVLAPLVTAADVEQVWASLQLAQKRAVLDLLCRVTILPAGKGARFTPEQVQIEWR